MDALGSGNFWAGVIAGIIIGVGVSVSTSLPGLVLRLARRKKVAEEAERERRAPIRMGALAIAAELRGASEIAFRCETGHHVPEETNKLVLNEWPARRDDMLGLREENVQLWSDLENAYAELGRSKRDGGHPPPNGWLVQLADRLSEAADS